MTENNIWTMTSLNRTRSFTGLELLHDSVKDHIKSTGDVVVCFIHWNLISNGYKCVGLGETVKSGERKSENLPAGWSTNQEAYVMRYKPDHSEEHFTLKIVKMGDSLLVHFMRNRDQRVTTSTVKPSQYAGSDVRVFERAFKNHTELDSRITNDIILPLSAVRPISNHQRSQHQQQTEDVNPLLIDPRRPRGDLPRYPLLAQPDDPFSIGRNDLDPLGGAGHRGGGMLMDPFRTPSSRIGYDPRHPAAGLPPGAIPPGARYDPIAPPGIRPEPNPDHLPPSGYDDMFL